jgi:hypothetical protein
MCLEGGLVLGKNVVMVTLVAYFPYLLFPSLFTEKKNRANRDEPAKIPTVPDVGKTVPNAVSN